MHEMSFATQILACVQRAAEAYPNATVSRVRVGAGILLTLNEASLSFCLNAIAGGTVMEHAVLELETLPLVFECPRCGRVDAGGARVPECPHCNRPVTVTGGSDLIVKEIELDEQDGQS